MIGVEDCVRLEENGLAYYIQQSDEQLLLAVKEEGLVNKDNLEKPKMYKEKQKNERLKNWNNKPLHGQILCQSEAVRDRKSWDWFWKGDLKKGTEGLITAQEQMLLRPK